MRLRSKSSQEQAQPTQLHSRAVLPAWLSRTRKQTAEHRLATQAANSEFVSSGRGMFSSLPTSLLGHIWPSKRLVHGQLVAKWLRDELYKHALDIELTSAKNIHFDAKQFLSSLNRWQSKAAKMKLDLDNITVWDGTGLDLLFAPSCRALRPRFPLLQSFEGSVGGILSRLDLSFCNLGDAGVDRLAHSIHQCRALHSLQLEHNSITDASVFLLVESLGQCKSLRRLFLGSNWFDEWTTVLLVTLHNCKALQQLTLFNSILEYSYNSDETDARALPEPQTVSVNQLCNLDVSNYAAYNWDEHVISLEKCQTLGSLLGQCPALKRLHLARNAVPDAGLEDICSGLANCGELCFLDVSHNGFGDFGLRLLASTMTSCRQLTELDLSFNDLHVEAVSSIAGIFQACPKLADLSLGDNMLRDEGVAQIAAELSKATCLKRLDLSHNRFYAEGADAVAEGVKQSTVLEFLSVEDNWMEDEGARKMSTAIRSCRTMKELRMAGTGISKAGVETLAKASSKKRKVHFSITPWKISEKQQDDLDRAWAGRCVFMWTAIWPSFL